MIISAGKRRLVSYQYGWKIEIEKVRGEDSKNPGQKYWTEDSPAYPASLAQACENLLERELRDGEDITLDQLPEALKRAAHTVREYMQKVRAAA